MALWRCDCPEPVLEKRRVIFIDSHRCGFLYLNLNLSRWSAVCDDACLEAARIPHGEYTVRDVWAQVRKQAF